MRKILINVIVLCIVALFIATGITVFRHFDLGPPWGIGREDIDRELGRWWVLAYKLYEMELDKELDVGSASNILIEAQEVAEKNSEVMIASESDLKQNPDMEGWDEASLKEKYRYISEKNKYLEKAIVELGGEEDLKEIEGKWSLEEVPDLWEKVNNASEGGDN